MDKSRHRIRAGIEIECVFNPEIIKNFIKKTGYDYTDARYTRHHSIYTGKKLNNWVTKYDGSLGTHSIDGFKDSDGDYTNGVCVEFESKLLNSKKHYFNALKEIKKLFNSDDNNLRDVLSFNRTCGNHLHIGFKDNKKTYSNKLNTGILIKARELFFQKMLNSDAISDETKQKIKGHYFRHYAQEIDNYNFLDTRPSERYLEFNKQSEITTRDEYDDDDDDDDNKNKGLEWRSFNLLDVKNWAEFDELFKISYEILNFIWVKRANGYVLKTEKFKLDKIGFKKLLKNNVRGRD